jgi:hypothetical protein
MLDQNVELVRLPEEIGLVIGYDGGEPGELDLSIWTAPEILIVLGNTAQLEGSQASLQAGLKYLAAGTIEVRTDPRSGL